MMITTFNKNGLSDEEIVRIYQHLLNKDVDTLINNSDDTQRAKK